QDPRQTDRRIRAVTCYRAKSEATEVVDRLWSEWMGAAQRGDSAAYDRLLRAIVPYIRQIASRQHRRPELVDEIVQDVLLTLHRVRHTYDPSRSFRQWFGTIARRRSIDALRRQRRRLLHELPASAVGVAYEGYSDPAAEQFASAH